MENQEIRISSDGRRLDIQLSEASGMTRSRIAGLMEEGFCRTGDTVCRKAGTKPAAGTPVVLTVPAPRPAVPQAEDIPLEILYEDDDLAVIVKPRGMVVHPAAGHEDGTLVNALLGNLSELGGIGGELRPGIVHRLDKDTSGLMMVAKNDETQNALSLMLKNREIEKHYLALVEGVFQEREGRVEAPIARSRKDRKKMAVDPEGREAVTEWRVVAEGKNCTLLDEHILTGRTHQIRVHMRSIHHPVCGDPLYGYDKGARVPCLMLHARSLSFIHPRTGRKLAFHAPVPADFVKGLKSNGIGTAPDTLPEKEIRDLLSGYPEIVWGFTDVSYSDYAAEYASALVLAVPYGEQLTPEEYTEERFDRGIHAARDIVETVVPGIEDILRRQQVKYWVPPVAQENETELKALFSFKTAAARAGIGWFGKNDVIITERYGPRVRLSAILIDETFAYGEPITEGRCPEDCMKCFDICPCKALKGRQWTEGTDRSEIIDYHKCNQMRSAFIKKLGRKNACGLCMAVCPVGR